MFKVSVWFLDNGSEFWFVKGHLVSINNKYFSYRTGNYANIFGTCFWCFYCKILCVILGTPTVTKKTTLKQAEVAE